MAQEPELTLAEVPPGRIATYSKDEKPLQFSVLIPKECHEYFKYSPPFSIPTLELHYELPYRLSQVISAFRSITFDDTSKLPPALASFNKFSERSQISVNFSENNSRETLEYKAVLLPLLAESDVKELTEKNQTEKADDEITESKVSFRTFAILFFSLLRTLKKRKRKRRKKRRKEVKRVIIRGGIHGHLLRHGVNGSVHLPMVTHGQIP